LVTRAFRQIFLQAVYRLGKQPGRGRFTRPTWAGKEVGVPDVVTADGVLQGLDDMFLADDFIPQAGTPFAIEGLGHWLILL